MPGTVDPCVRQNRKYLNTVMLKVRRLQDDASL